MASILGSFQAAQAATNRANLQRYQEGKSLYDEIIGRYKAGGGFVKGQIAGLERRKVRGVAAGMMSLSQAGLAGTTLSAGLGKRWEEEVGTPARLSIADIAGQRLSQAQMAKAGFIERRQDVGPDPGMVSSLMRGVGRAQPDPYGGRTTFGASSFRNQGGVVPLQTSAGVNRPSISRARTPARRATTSPYTQKPYFSRWGQPTRAIPQRQRLNIARTLT